MSNLEGAVERFLKGDAAAFQELVDATSARLVRLSARMLGNVADAEDVVQEAYVKAYRSLLDGQFDRRAKVETWLYRIVINATIDARRKRTRRVATVDVEEETAGLETGDSPTEARLALTELADWLGELPPDQQATLVLKAVEGRESAEIAEILGCSEGAVEQRLVRARATLRQRRNES
ncbi:MAG TPA: RNA polymerase sigma factor [Polyangiaceae bacterium]|nr:RNA polymerase sigma factor [Polyangiaceae bacterium]